MEYYKSIQKIPYEYISEPQISESFHGKVLTDSNGLAKMDDILNLNVDDLIMIDLPTGEKFSGIVRVCELNDHDEYFKIIGDISSEENAGFGFKIMLDGLASGVVLLKNEKVSYTLGFDVELGGYTFSKKTFDSTTIPDTF